MLFLKYPERIVYLWTEDDGAPVDCYIYDICVSETQSEFLPPDAPCIAGYEMNWTGLKTNKYIW